MLTGSGFDEGPKRLSHDALAIDETLFDAEDLTITVTP